MDLCFSLKCTKNKDDDYKKRDGNTYTIPNYVTDDYILSCNTNSFSSLISLKNNGNRHYKSYKFSQAVECYTKALVSFSQEKNDNTQGNKNNENSFEFTNVNDVHGHNKKNSSGIPKMSSSVISAPSHISSPLATSSNININTNNKNNNNNNNKYFPTSDSSSYKILKMKGDDESSNNLDKYFEENHIETSFNSTSPKSPDINPKIEFINQVEKQYQIDNENVESQNHKPKKNKSNNKKDISKNQQLYSTPHPKVKPLDVMILYSTLLANRSASYIRLKQYSKANTDADHIIEIRPNWIKGYYRKAEALKGLKRYLESLDYYHQALKFNPSSEKILNAISTIEILLRNEELGIKIYQLVPGYDICVKKSLFKPIQYILFSYALQMQNYIYILADIKSRQCVLIDACWDIDGILEHVRKEKLTVIGAIYTHFHIDHTGGIPPPPYNKYMVKVEGMVKLSKIYPNIPFFIGPRDIDFVLKQNPEFNRNRFVPIEDRQILTLDDIISLNKSRVKRRTHVNDRIKTNQEKFIPPKDNIYNSGNDSVISHIKNEIISDDGAIIEKDDNFTAPISDINSTIDNNFKFNSNKSNSNKMYMSIKGLSMTDYKVKRLSNLNEDALPLPDDNGTDVYSNCNLNEVSNNDFENAFNNAVGETSIIENSNMGNISNICYDGENSLKFYEHDGNNILDGNKGKIPYVRGSHWNSNVERSKNKFKTIEDNKNYLYNNRINDTISTISMVNIDKKDYNSNAYGKPTHKIDEFRIQFIFTPGHTLGSMCILVNDERLFSGDTLLIGTCGRIDFPESSPEEMYDSLMNVLGRLDDDVVVYPSHSYGGDEWTTIAQEKLFGSMYDHGDFETWLFELTGCVKNQDGSSISPPESKNEMMAMIPVSPVISHNLQKHENSSKFSKDTKSDKDDDINEEKNSAAIIAKKDEERKGFFNNHEYINMNNVNNINNKNYKPINSSPIAGPSTINSGKNSAPTGTENHVISSNTDSTQKQVTVNHRRTNSNSNVVTYTKRKESLINKPHLQIQQQKIQRKSIQMLPPQPPQHQSSSSSTEIKYNLSTKPMMKTVPDNREITPTSENIILMNASIPSKSIVNSTKLKNSQNNEISSISSSTSTTSDSLSISSSTSSISNKIIENYNNTPITFKDNVNSKPSLKEKPSIETGTKITQSGLLSEASSTGASSYDQIIPSSIKEQMNKSSEIDESYDSENYEKNKHILNRLSLNSYGVAPISPHNLMMTELYHNEDENSSSTTDDNDDGDEESQPKQVNKKKSFLNNVFKKRSFERNHYVMNNEE